MGVPRGDGLHVQDWTISEGKAKKNEAINIKIRR